MTLEQFESATEGELRRSANELFEEAETAGGNDKPHLYAEAQFYIGEIERRKQGKANSVSFWMELLVILLILGEIVITLYQGSGQTEILQKLQTSAAATANTLQTLETTTESMNTAVQAQLDLFYEPSVVASFDGSTKELHVINAGRTNIELCGSKLDVGAPVLFKRPSVMPPAEGYRFSSAALFDQLAGRVPKTSTLVVPYDLYIRTERHQEYVVHLSLAAFWQGNTIAIFTQLNTTSQTKWSK